MHVTGKILVFMVLLLAVGGFIMGAKVFEARKNWMQQFQQAKDKNDATARQLADARAARDQARDKAERETMRWNRYWNNVQAGYIQQNTNIVANAGASLGWAPKMNLYAFQLNEKGEPTYVGAFSALDVGPNNSTLKADFRVRSEDTKKWTSNRWRFRTMIPSAEASQINHLEAELTTADELLVKQRNNLDLQKKLIEAARQQQEQRLTELRGGGPANSTPGLVDQIAQEEDQRNESLVEVDRLRRAIRSQLQAVQRLIRENNELARSLPSLSTGKEMALGQ